MRFTTWMNVKWQKDNMFPPPLDGQVAVHFLCRYLLGDDWYSVNPISQEQINVEIVHEILYKYSRKYRKEWNRDQKRAKMDKLK